MSKLGFLFFSSLKHLKISDLLVHYFNFQRVKYPVIIAISSMVNQLLSPCKSFTLIMVTQLFKESAKIWLDFTIDSTHIHAAFIFCSINAAVI